MKYCAFCKENNIYTWTVVHFVKRKIQYNLFSEAPIFQPISFFDDEDGFDLFSSLTDVNTSQQASTSQDASCSQEASQVASISQEASGQQETSSNDIVNNCTDQSSTGRM